MLTPGIIITRLYETLSFAAKDRRVEDLRVGLSYVGVQLDDGTTALAAVVPENISRACTVLHEAGAFAGASASELLKNLVEAKDTLRRAIGLATANALISGGAYPEDNREATSTFHLQPGEKVAMVGLFAPLVERIRKTGAILTIIEKNPQRIDVLSPEGMHKALQECDVAIVTATTLLNNTFEEIVEHLGKPRLVAVMGPTTPLLPEVFQDTPVTHLGGAVVADAARALQIISEGGGTPALRPCLRFINLILKK